MRESVLKHVHITVSIYLTYHCSRFCEEFIYLCICIQMGQMDVGFMQGFVVTQLRSMMLAAVLYQALANT